MLVLIMKYYFAVYQVIFYKFLLLILIKTSICLVKLSKQELFIILGLKYFNFTSSSFSQIDLRIIESLKEFRFSLKDILLGTSKLNSCKSSEIQKFQEKLGKRISKLKEKFLKKLNFNKEDLEKHIINSGNIKIKSLYTQLQEDIYLLFRGVLPEITKKVLDMEESINVLNEIFQGNLMILDIFLGRFIQLKQKICMDSEEFYEISQNIEHFNLIVKYLIYCKYGLIHENLPSKEILAKSIEIHSESNEKFSEKVKDMEEEHQAMTQVILGLVIGS